MERSNQRQLGHLGLPTACAVIYSKLAGTPPDPRNAREMQATLNDVARAVSTLVAIYAPDENSGVPRALPPEDVIEGQFLRGAQVFRTKQGDELRGLTIQRRDLFNAISVLQSAHIRFRRPGED
jgi:hypothetical protein